MNDSEIKIINAKFPDELETKVNELLSQGGWRITETEMSVTDHHYFVMMIKSNEGDDA